MIKKFILIYTIMKRRIANIGEPNEEEYENSKKQFQKLTHLAENWVDRNKIENEKSRKEQIEINSKYKILNDEKCLIFINLINYKRSKNLKNNMKKYKEIKFSLNDLKDPSNCVKNSFIQEIEI
ncbi:unnamed protein product [Paramecium sonneborni]|uniref:Uncharacterized protein n=1 Tax=Paramecium sonneborni TaxID=65129 RepID=A0A8S1JUD5_9CILI|nr:unnamed protein product [Paramecium sonneborni]